MANGAYVLGKNMPGFGGRGVFIDGDQIEPELWALENFIDKGDVFIDIGANTGVYTMKAAKSLDGTGTVIACEPFVGVFESLIRSVEYNKFSNVRLRNLCIGARRELRRFYMNFNKPNSFSLSQFDDKASYVEVLAISLDDLVKWEKLDRLSYIKIDAEGAEEDILLGSQEAIKKFRPIIQLEVETVYDKINTMLPDYSCFMAPNSPNCLLIPDKHSKIDVPAKLGWNRHLD